MKIDPYSPCPGGFDKKIKFCDSCKDHLGDLDKIYKLLDGEQRAACLDAVEKVDAATPDRACVLAIKVLLESQLGMQDRANRTLSHFIGKFPENPVALAEQAILNAADGLLPPAVDTLQVAIQNCKENLPGRVLDAISVVGRALVAQGHILAARGHLMLELGFTAGEDGGGAMQLLMRINSSQDVPILFKDDAHLKPCPEGADCKAAYDEAVELAARGSWRAAERKFSELSKTNDAMPEWWHNLAVLRSWLANEAGAVAALRKLATLDIPLDDAVEAEATAQMLDEAVADEEIDLLRVVVDTSDLDRLMEALAASPRAVSVAAPPRMEEDQPPPRAVYWLLDRDAATTGVGIGIDEVPRLLGHMLVFGKQTDREARVEIIAYRGDALDATMATLREIAGDVIADSASEENVIGHTTAVSRTLNVAWRLPEDTPPEHARELFDEYRQDAIFAQWPKLPLGPLGGKTPVEAAADGSLAIKVLAAILMLEYSTDSWTTEIDYNRLRSQLGLPTADPIPGAEVKADLLPLARFPRLVVADVSDDHLVTLFRRAAMTHFTAAIQLIGHEVVGRASLDDTVDKAEANAILARHATTSDASLDYLAKARDAAEAQKESPARWYLEELPIRLERGESKEAENIIQVLRDKHFNEPGVADALYRLLSEIQAAAQQGMPMGPPAAAPAEMAPAGAQAAPSEGKLWTPDSEQGGGGGKLWTPDG